MCVHVVQHCCHHIAGDLGKMYYSIAVLIVCWVLFSVLCFPLTVFSLLKNCVSRLWRGHNKITVKFHKDSKFCKSLVQKCPILRERYYPPLLWGYIGHLQTLIPCLCHINGANPSFNSDEVKVRRHYLHVDDGSTISYEVFEPIGMETRDIVIVVVPGIGNTAESDGIRPLCKHASDIGYRVAVLNHVGALENCGITGHRVFTYGGTGDLILMFDDLVTQFGPNTKFACVGYSMGGTILVKFLGEQPNYHERIICAISIGQGYSANEGYRLTQSEPRWQEMRWFYQFGITKEKMVNLVKRHKEMLITRHPIIKQKLSLQSDPSTTRVTTGSIAGNDHGIVPKHTMSSSVNGQHSASNIKEQNGCSSPKKVLAVPCLPGSERDCNGFPLDPNRISAPDKRMWKAKTIMEFAEYYTRRVMGFDSGHELRKWISCDNHLNSISDLSLLLVNSFDDHVIPRPLTEIAIKYTEFNHKAMFVGTEHGGHCVFVEGGWVVPNQKRWTDRLVLQYIEACKA